MAEDIKSLIKKIQEEGVLAAEQKAKKIEDEARILSQDILLKARAEADKIIASAKEEAAKEIKQGEALLKQAGRNMLISLRRQIQEVLSGLILAQIRQSLDNDTVAKVITLMAKEAPGKDVLISLNPEDAEKIKQGFLRKLQEETKKEITLASSEDIRAGFIISYDKGKSSFDFTDQALAEYLGGYLNPELAKLLGEKP